VAYFIEKDEHPLNILEFVFSGQQNCLSQQDMQVDE
jgi:hypothetical protein